VDTASPRTVTFGGRYRPDGVLDRHVSVGTTIAPRTAQDMAALDRALQRLVDGLRLDYVAALGAQLDMGDGPEVRH